MKTAVSPVVKVDRRIRWHYTTTIFRLRIGARLTAHFYPCVSHILYLVFSRLLIENEKRTSRYWRKW